jgi:hypothetical protein
MVLKKTFEHQAEINENCNKLCDSLSKNINLRGRTNGVTWERTEIKRSFGVET